MQKSDAIVVLGGDDYGSRVVTAAKLQQAGYAPIVVVSGPPLLMSHESDQMIEYARRQGFPTSIFLKADNNQNSTRSETVFLGNFLRAHNYRKIILVTSSYHTRRAYRLMTGQNPTLDVRVAPAPDPFFTPSTWWLSRNGQKTFFYEWMKTIATALGE